MNFQIITFAALSSLLGCAISSAQSSPSSTQNKLNKQSTTFQLQFERSEEGFAKNAEWDYLATRTVEDSFTGKTRTRSMPKAKKLSFTGNPLFIGADPDVLVLGKDYWVCPTTTGTEDDCYAYSSPDLKSWTKHGPIFDLKNVGWINDDGAKEHYLWAPGIFKKRAQYYLYYSVGPQNPTPSRIGVAVSRKPQGPFVDSGKPLVTGGNGFEAIDAMVFEDPQAKGRTYLYCGGSAGARLRVFELNWDLVSIKNEVKVQNPPHFTEASFMHYHNGTYYLSYSNGKWNDDSYRVCYSTAPTALGPWTYKGVILKTDGEHAGPGHHAIFQNPTNKRWYIMYHRWNGAKSSGQMPASRSVAIENLRYNRQGEILPVIMTNVGVTPSALR